MDFAKRQLEKYGWKEGKGLGKNEDGISSALKATLKFDNTGVGHEVGKDFTNKWWENVYNSAAKNIEVVKDEKKIKVKRVANAEEVEITTKDYSVRDFKKKNGGMEYGTFLKTAKLTQEGVVNYDDVHAPEEHVMPQVTHLSDEDLFAICGGRTAHKGARHGLKLSGKLSRIEKQEKLLLKKMKKVHLNESEETVEKETCKKKLKKLKKLSDSMMDAESEPSTSDSTLTAEKAKKKKKKRKKSVSFSETVLEYTVQEPNDESPGCSTSSVEKVEIQERHLSPPSPTDNDNDNVTTDEGIEQDCDVKHIDCSQECFSEMQSSKKDKKKKKLKKHDKEVEEASSVEITEIIDDDHEGKSKEKKKVRKRCQDADIDRVKNMKKKKKQRHNEIEDIDTSMVELQISE